MASIVRRGKCFAVVYYINGKQKWESFKKESDAHARIQEIEENKASASFIPLTPVTIQEFMAEYVESYGSVKWSHSTYSCNTSLIRNYINPLIGQWKMKDITTKKMDSFFSKLKTLPAVHQKATSEPNLISDRSIYDINLLLSNAFKKAADWEYIGKNPITRNTCPNRLSAVNRDFWTPDVAKDALAACRDMNLLVCMHLAIACSMRIGEITGLRWQYISFGDLDNRHETAALLIDSQLQRISKTTYSALLRKKDQIKLVFPSSKENANTMLVLKTLKTKGSHRVVWIPPTVAAYLKKIKERQEELLEILGDAYQDYDLVIAQDNGRPLEGSRISEMFAQFILDQGFPKVDFHSLRHLSTTVKLLISNGDVKLVQGETGHSQSRMVTDTYAHILDQNRRTMAQKFEESFYQSEHFVHAPPEVSADQLIAMFLKNPTSTDMVKNILGKR